MSWDYGNDYKKFPVEQGIAVFSDGSMLKTHDIFDPLPSFMLKADLMFIDPPWNQGNISTFYTKADKEFTFDFKKFCIRLFSCIKQINPNTCYVEIGKEYLDFFIFELKKQFKYVTFYNSSYYHKKDNKCYVVRGSNNYKKPKLDYLDEEDIIQWICKNENYTCIADCCMGRGLVAVNAFKSGHKFVGTELNHKRLSVTISKICELGGKYEIVLPNSLKELRLKNNLTQQQIADIIGINVRNYVRYENGREIGNINFKSGILLSQTLGINPSDLI